MNRHPGGLFVRGRGGDTADLREHNLALVLRYLRDNGPSSRAQIAHSSTLGLSTLTGMIGELKALDLVTEGLADTQSRLGRPTHAVSLSGHGWVVAGLRVDVDGIQAKTATVGGDHLGSYADRADLRGGDPAQAIRMLAAAIDWIVESVDPPRVLTAVSISVAGRVSRSGDVVVRSDALDWSDVDLASGVREQLAALGFGGAVVQVVSESATAALGLVRGELRGRITERTMLYFGGERAVVGEVLVAGESAIPGGLGGAEFARIPVTLDGGERRRLGDLVSLAGLLTTAGVRSDTEAAELVDRFPREALSVLLATVAEGDEGAMAAVAAAMESLSQAIEAAVAVVGVDVVVLDGYLGVLGTLIAPAVEADVEVIALPSHPSRIVDGAVFAARDARLSQPSRIRG